MRGLTVSLVLLALLASGCSLFSSSEPESESSSRPSTTEALSSEENAAAAVSEEIEGATHALRIDTEKWNTDFTKRSVSLDEFWSLVPFRDGIPPVDDPVFVDVDHAGEWLDSREPVIEVELGDGARAYPLQILVWHEIVNDEFSGTPLVVTFCPLCYTALAFERTVNGEVLDFGTTGNVRNSDLVMYDRQTESWWQQFGGEAIVGELTGTTLMPVPAAIVAWEDFAARHQDGDVLSRETGFERYYGINPYAGYDTVDNPPFFRPENTDDTRLLPKERVVFFELDDESIAVPFAALEQQGRIGVDIGGERVEVFWLEGVRSSLDQPLIRIAETKGAADVRSVPTGERIAFDTPFWFAVAAFRPDVRIVDQ